MFFLRFLFFSTYTAKSQVFIYDFLKPSNEDITCKTIDYSSQYAFMLHVRGFYENIGKLQICILPLDTSLPPS